MHMGHLRLTAATSAQSSSTTPFTALCQLPFPLKAGQDTDEAARDLYKLYYKNGSIAHESTLSFRVMFWDRFTLVV